MSTGGEWIGRACALGQPLGLMRSASKKVTFASATTGVTSSLELFTVGGTIGVNVFGVCDGDIYAPSGTSTIALGTANATEHFMSGMQADGLDNTEIWAPKSVAAAYVLWSGIASTFSIVKSTDIGYTIGTGTINSGSMTFYAYWTPISPGSWLEVQDTPGTLLV